MTDKDAEIEKLRAEVVELKKGLKDMAGEMGNMQKEFGQICLAMGRAMGYVNPSDHALPSATNSPRTAASPTPTSTSPNPSTVNPSTTLSLSSSSKGDDESSAVSSVEEKKPTTTSSSSASVSSKSSKSSTKPAAKPAPAPFKPAEIEIEKGEEGSLGEASTMSQSGVGEGVGFVLSPDPAKKQEKQGSSDEPALQQSQSKLFTLSDSEDSQSLGQSITSSSVGMSNSGVSDSLSMPSKVA
ncbi:hypothetical protein TrVE_jg2213 [Triparma verrucosa]|uniref:Uncharacterized protein n=1 Tax=Triparma verrucosa TaxID=1606542 RepID=A0A9W7EQP1_9STRA|nr:hypothetical protein TrVE_jg2213 [Triparma verrucosa]